MNKNPESKDSLVNHPIKILKLSVIAMIALLIIGFIILQLDSEVMGIVLMAAGVCCVVLALTGFWRCPTAGACCPSGSGQHLCTAPTAAGSLTEVKRHEKAVW